MWPVIITTGLISLTSLALYWQSKKEDPEKIFGVYSRPGKWYCIKYLIMFVFLETKRLKAKFSGSWSDESSEYAENLINTTTSMTIKDMEKLQPLSDHDKAFDAVFFQAVNMKGYYMCGGTERRHEAKSFGLFYIVVPGLGLLSSERLPSTLLQTDPVSIHLQNTYSAEGISFTPVKPMMLWKVCFNGKMRLQGHPDATYDVKLEANWISDYPYFLYERDLNSKALARSLAQEVWSKTFFQTLKESHQVHYEQMGHLRGTLLVNGEKHELNMQSFRDHSFGHKRDWSLIHRYAFHMIYLSDNRKIVIGAVSHPSSFSHFHVGYVVHPDKTLDSIESSDLYLYNHGEKGMPGKDIAFSLVAGGKSYVVKVTVQYEAEHFKGHDNEARLIERFLTYEVNGVQGRGIAEWHYNVGKKDSQNLQGGDRRN